MRAHQINGAGLILRTVIVNTLDDMPGLIDASIGGGVGDSVIAGVLVPAPVVVPVPAAVTMRQARLVMHSAGLLGPVSAAIAAMPEPAKTAATIEWEYSNELQRDHALVTALGAALGLTSSQVDDLFRAAAAL